MTKTNYVILPEQWLISIHFWLVTSFGRILASNLKRLYLHMKQYHFQFPIRFFMSYLANIRSNNRNPQIIYVADSFFFLLQASTFISCHRVLVFLTHVLQIFIVLTIFFCFSSDFFMRMSHFCHLTEKILTLPTLQNI